MDNSHFQQARNQVTQFIKIVSQINSKYCWTLQSPVQEPHQVSNLLASLGHTGRWRVVLGHTFNTQTLTKADEQKNRFQVNLQFCVGPHSEPPWATCDTPGTLDKEVRKSGSQQSRVYHFRNLRATWFCLGLTLIYKKCHHPLPCLIHVIVLRSKSNHAGKSTM